MKNDKISIDFERCWVHFNPRKSNKGLMNPPKYNHYNLWRFIIKKLRNLGWRIYVSERYKNGGQFEILRSGNRAGEKIFSGFKLEFKTEITPNSISFEFYQNHVFTNSNGGEYDFDKYKKMPYLLKKAYELTSYKIKDMILGCYPNALVHIETAKRLTSEQQILKHCRTSSFDRKKIRSLEETPNYMSDYDFGCNSTDKDGKTIECGELKYYYDYNGRLSKGYVYHNINNMWWVVSNDHYYRNKASFQLFDLTPEILEIRRKKDGRPPKEYVKKMEILKACSSKELKRALKRKIAA